jgi:hypothetical protein
MIVQMIILLRFTFFSPVSIRLDASCK